MYNEYTSSDDVPVYDEYEEDDYPRREDMDTLNHSIEFFCNGDLRTYADKHFGVASAVSVETLDQMRLMADVLRVIEDYERMLQAPLPPPAGYATCCACGEFTPNTSAKCQCCGGLFCPF